MVIAVGQYNFAGLQTAVQEIIIPYVQYARTKGVYVTIDLEFTFNDYQSTTPENLAKFKEIWGYIASQPELKSADNVMFELINEPVQSYANGHWSGWTGDPDYVDHWKALRDFQNEIISTIRETGADNVIWAAGLGWDQLYELAAIYPITDPLSNYGYAVHWYPGYGGGDDMAALQSIWDTTIKPAADVYPINITECVWFKRVDGDPEYWNLFNASSEGFGKNTKSIFTAAGNVSVIMGANGELLEPGPRSSVADPTAGIKWDGDTTRDAMGRFVFDWFYERAQSYPGSGISNGIVSGAVYKLINRSSGKVVDIPGGQDVSGLQLQQWSDLGGTAQQWVITNMGSGHYEIKSVSANNKVMDVKNGTKANGEKIQLMADFNNTAQRFTIYALGNGYHSIINVNSNKALTVSGNSMDNGGLLIQDGYTGNFNQQWQLARVNLIALKSVAYNQYVAAEKAGAGDLIANRSVAAVWETFEKVDNGDGTISLRADANQKFVCAENGGANALIANREQVGGTWERFQVVDNGDGTISLKSLANHLFVSAEQSGDFKLIANKTSVIGATEKFIMEAK
ncbi:RICIN domain-containing protein [Paenibacillus sp. LHD-117]|uniref:RICIN domain-containing protein n=1 Tax=Paenibacillus sp. LHD-117 TaxID=3071412 RepID=UPI0027DF9599|nr:RICIN domain-containing protein [Paenibacillus sp. LHD-117]MDQ6417882.1 RICIN domain-containing protein [Paenibacillus sp. LHD-117]